MPKKTKKAKLKAEAAHHRSIPTSAELNPSQVSYQFAASNATSVASSPTFSSQLMTSHFPAIKRDLLITLILSALAISTEFIIAWKIK